VGGGQRGLGGPEVCAGPVERKPAVVHRGDAVGVFAALAGQAAKAALQVLKPLLGGGEALAAKIAIHFGAFDGRDELAMEIVANLCFRFNGGPDQRMV
jgi:hypothetical protein